ncbi:MAG: trimethylamine methyltransferase family protein [Anaerolineae bacterium]|nr:trimethylamine methyltransferase family protein [Anaerolineae bacterium]
MTEQIACSTYRPTLRMLSDEQIRTIHSASLDILSATGIELRSDRARRLLLDAGASQAGSRILIPERLVMQALASAPSRIPMHNRLGELTMPLEEGKVFFGPGSDCPFTVDVETRERRASVAADVERFAQLCDALPNIDFVMSMGIPSDVPTMDHYVHSFIRMIRGSVKPNVYTARDRRDMEAIYRIACAVAGGEAELRARPFLMLYAEPISPLLYNEESLDNLLFCAEKGIPVAYPPSPNTGGGGPITVAGAIALGNAECLAGLVLTQLVRPGTPFLYGMNVAALDMQTTIIAYGAPDWGQAMAAFGDMARHYRLPFWGGAGASDSKVVDAQAGFEATSTIMTAFLSRCNLVHDVGYIEYGSTSSMELLVICDEIIGHTRFIVDGVEVSERTLARAAIGRARPGAGFFADDHTLENWKWAQWRPRVVDRMRYANWAAKGSKDMATRANERARRLLKEHHAPPLSAEAEATIAEVLRQRFEAPVLA